MKRLLYVVLAISLAACSSGKTTAKPPASSAALSSAGTTSAFTSAAASTSAAAASSGAAPSTSSPPASTSPSAAGSAPAPASTTSAAPETSKPAVPNVKAQALALGDLPAGWSVEKQSKDNSGEPTCFKKLAKLQNAGGKPLAHVEVQFQGSPDGLPSLDESIDAVRSGIKADFSAVVKALARCGRISVPSNGTTLSGTITPMSFPKIGDESKAYQLLLSGVVNKVRVTAGFDILLFGVGNEEVTLLYTTLGAPAISEFQGATKLALDKIRAAGGGTTT